MVEKLMSTADLAEVLHIKPETVRRMRWDGSGPRFIRRGKRAWYDPADVRAWIEHQKRTSTSAPAPKAA